MDVHKVGKAGLNKIKPKKEVAQESVSFTEVMSSKRNQQTYDKLTRLMADIEDQGKVLAESRTVEDLRKYKQLVKDFMEDAVQHGLRLQEQRGFNRRGRTKIYKIVEMVDKKLVDLTNAVLEKEKKGLEILGMVGEIKGMLINIYT